MTVNVTAYAIQANSHPADVFRRALKATRAIQGVVAPGDMAVTQNGTPNMSVNIAAGTAVVDGTQNTTTQGAYHCLNDATVNLAIAASDPTNPRIDIVCISIQDAAYSGGANQALLQVVTGTPAGSPVAPATPANSIVLAQVSVAANATTVVNANITDKRAFVWQSIQLGVTGLTVLSSGGNNSLVVNDASLVTLRNALNIPPSAGGTLAPTSYGTLPLKFDEKTPSGVATTSFTLPSGFTHAHFRGQARGDANVAALDMYGQFNGDTGSSYVYQQFYGSNNTATSSQQTSATTQPIIVRIPGATANANAGATFTIDVMNYSGSTFIKECISVGQSWEGAAINQEWLLHRSFRWNATTALTSILFGLSSGNYVSGSKISGYVWP